MEILSEKKGTEKGHPGSVGKVLTARRREDPRFQFFARPLVLVLRL